MTIYSDFLVGHMSITRDKCKKSRLAPAYHILKRKIVSNKVHVEISFERSWFCSNSFNQFRMTDYGNITMVIVD